MKKLIILTGLLLVVAGALAVAFSPDILSLIIIGLMCLILAAALPPAWCPCCSTPTACVQPGTTSSTLNEITDRREPLCAHTEYSSPQTLDNLFAAYRAKVNQQQKDSRWPATSRTSSTTTPWPSAAGRTWSTRSRPHDRPGPAGHLPGPDHGISGITFSSVDATINSIQTCSGASTWLLHLHCGRHLSMLFNLTHKLLWNILIRELVCSPRASTCTSCPAWKNRCGCAAARDGADPGAAGPAAQKPRLYAFRRRACNLSAGSEQR